MTSTEQLILQVIDAAATMTEGTIVSLEILYDGRFIVWIVLLEQNDEQSLYPAEGVHGDSLDQCLERMVEHLRFNGSSGSSLN